MPAGATMAMDLWAIVLRRSSVPSLNPALLGPWIGHRPRGHWIHLNFAKATPVRGESWTGWCAHDAIGIAFAALLLWTDGLGWARSPSLRPALLVGIVTVVAPWLILQPAMGAGIASWKTPTPVFNGAKSLVAAPLVAARGSPVPRRVP